MTDKEKDLRITLRLTPELVELVREAMARTREFNRTLFIQKVLRIKCNEILKQ